MPLSEKALAEIRRLTIELDEIQFRVTEGYKLATAFGAPPIFVLELDDLQREVNHRRALLKTLRNLAASDI